MNWPTPAFELCSTALDGSARCGLLHTPHGSVETPCFMPVGTQATVKGLTVDQLHAAGVQMLLANTYHLMLRPGEDVVAALGGLHAMMGWDGPILTDSGGFQIFSLAHDSQVTDAGVAFRSHVDGALVSLTPDRAIEIQRMLASDVAMVLDHVVSLPNTRAAIEDATERTVAWAARCRAAAAGDDQVLFGIVQGGLEPDLRVSCARRLIALDFVGYAVGGLSVGEHPAEMYDVLEMLDSVLPADRPRYLMGVGRPADLVEAIGRGIDLFDCVMPTRNGRNALAFTDRGTLRLRNRRFQEDRGPLEDDCPCPACRHSRGYLRHLFMSGEMLGPVLLSAHNVTYYERLVSEARAAIAAGCYAEFRERKLRQWRDAESAST